MAAVEITQAHYAALQRVVDGAGQFKSMVDQYVACAARITQNPPAEQTQWHDSSFNATRTALYTELHALGAALATAGTAAHDAAAGVVTDWTP